MNSIMYQHPHFDIKTTHKGTNKVKEIKIYVLVHMFELFQMEKNENLRKDY